MRLVRPSPSEWIAALVCGVWMAAWLVQVAPWGLVLAAATAAALLFICRFTILAALVIAALQLAGTMLYSSEENPAGLAPFLATSYFLARYVTAGSRGLLVGAVFLYSSMAGSVHDLQTVIYVCLLFGGPFVFGRVVRRRALAAERAQTAAASFARADSAAMAQEAIADERGRLGGQVLSVIRSSVEQMNNDAAAAARNLDPDLIGRIADRGRAAVTELRWLLGLLRTSPAVPPAGQQNRRPSPWRADALTAAGAGFLSFLEAVLTGPPPGNALAWILPAALPLPLAFRRRNPAVACLAVAALITMSTTLGLPFIYGFTLGPMITFTVLAWSVAAARQWSGWAGLCVLLAAVLWRMYMDQPGSVPLVLGMFVMPALAGQEWSTRDRDRRSAQAQGNALAADLHGNIDRAVRLERLRIARELHDVTSHAVGVMVLQASAAQALHTRDPQAARSALANVESAGEHALAELAELFRVLDAGAIGSPGLAAASAETLEELTVRMRTAGLNVDLAGDAFTVPDELARTIHRTVQEALTNVARHAPGTRATVNVSNHDKSIVITVTNDLPRLAAAGGSTGFGLAGIRERVESLGGSLTVNNTGGSFTVTAYFPVPDVTLP
ncbi:sensor histidine kinase [Arthrobacter sp. W4I7]|uniref:sensor histidine kinase n=1 Tax=Arthrobacter sp. W4I7 TaxID=3042296 RepID=UPI0027842071|nr:histidine kinase [Arthrobacter sp. W4I7]MDQ0691012.1 signal transduction histidine kinase [Arthrobacter sp. W4I7]